PGQRGADGGPGRRALQLVRGLLEPADEKQLAGTAEERLRDLAARVDLGRGGRVRGRSAALHEVERFGRLLAVIAVLEAAHRLGIERAGLLLLAERRARTPGPVEEARRVVGGGMRAHRALEQLGHVGVAAVAVVPPADPPRAAIGVASLGE